MNKPLKTRKTEPQKFLSFEFFRGRNFTVPKPLEFIKKFVKRDKKVSPTPKKIGRQKFPLFKMFRNPDYSINEQWELLKKFAERDELTQIQIKLENQSKIKSINTAFLDILNEQSITKYPPNENLPEQYQSLIGLEKEKEAELCRRNQGYAYLDYALKMSTYYDFFSKDALQMLKKCQQLLVKYEKEVLETDLFLLSFFCLRGRSTLPKTLSDFKMTYVSIEKMIDKEEERKQAERETKRTFRATIKIKPLKKKITVESTVPDSPLNPFFKRLFREIKFRTRESFTFIKKQASKIYTRIEKPIIKKILKKQGRKETLRRYLKSTRVKGERPNHSEQIYTIFERASEKALRYRVPIITPETLFLTLMEEKNGEAAEILKKFATTKVEKQLLRYRILLQIYHQELNIRTMIPMGQAFFGYLLQTELSTFNFQTLIEEKTLKGAVNTYRNQLIQGAMKADIPFLLEEELCDFSRQSKDLPLSKRPKKALMDDILFEKELLRMARNSRTPRWKVQIPNDTNRRDYDELFNPDFRMDGETPLVGED